MSQPLNFQCTVEQRYYSIIHLMKNTTSNSAFVALYPYELYYSKRQVQKLDTFFNLKSQTEFCGALRVWMPFVRFGERPWGGGRCCWWGCGLGALESAIVCFGHWGLKRYLHPTLGFSKCFVIFLSVKLFGNL